MKRDLIDVIFASEKRKNVLLLLHEGPKTMDEFLKSLKTTRPALLPQMKILQDHHLIIHAAESYQLTSIGELAVKKMLPLLSTLDVLSDDIDYWGALDLDLIPFPFLKRISELNKCTVVNISLMDIYNIDKFFHESSLVSESSCVITTFLYPNCNSLFQDLIDNHVKVHFILSQEALARLRPEHHAFFKELITSELVRLFVYPKKLSFSLAFNDYCTILSPMRKDDQMSTKFILSRSASAHSWSKEVFNHFLSESLPLQEFHLDNNSCSLK